MSTGKQPGAYLLKEQNSETPFFHQVALLAELNRAAETGELYTYHFNMLRTVLEKTASFHGYSQFSACLKKDESDVDCVLHARLINILSHGNYSLYEPNEMMDENKSYFRDILNHFMSRFHFNPEHFFVEAEETEAS